MTPLEEEIVKLTQIWYEYVNQDHHKDRDCHFEIVQRYSYGEEPYYKTYHYGYVGGDFEGTKCTTIEEAQDELKTFLLRQIYEEKQWANRMIKEIQDKPDEDYWYEIDHYKKMLEILARADEFVGR